ncbi:Rossmann-fold NAD(P)-binding domain-containing protein [Levilactobacillus enshiensis]|uniref:hypothetical protein n=1 Tax=Levilactobacillus enshiensis TaxID=2590213 RepID=UPI00177BD209|nr:hypothetical protein [Levilactobacillus enshiensis]
MKRILLAGALDAASQTFVRQLSQNSQLDLTVYTPSAVTLPTTVTALTGEAIDEGGLTAAMLDQDVVVALVPTIHLAAMTRTLATAASAAGARQLIVSRTDDIVELPGEIRDARRNLMASGVTFDLVEGFAGISTLMALETPRVFTTVTADDPLADLAG